MRACPYRRLLQLLLILALSGLGCTETGNGSAGTDLRSPGPFSEVEIRGGWKLEVVLQHEGHSVELSGDSNLLPLVTTEIQKHRLVIEVSKSAVPKLPLVAKVHAPDVKLLRNIGSNEVKLRKVDNGSVVVEIEGSGRTVAEGRTHQLKVYLRGAGKAELGAMPAKEAFLMVKGSGTVDLNVSDALEANIKGSAKVTYGGSPKVTKWLSGSAKLQQRKP